MPPLYPFNRRDLLLYGAGLLIAGAITGAHLVQESSRSPLDKGKSPLDMPPARDWNGLLQTNPDTVGWLSVRGTSIDTPIVQDKTSQQDTSTQDRYLDHGFEGTPSWKGWPYLDKRCDVDSRHLLNFGHTIEASAEGFSTISLTWKESRFDAVGEARWETPDGEPVSFLPYCALKVPASYQEIQTFQFNQEADWTSWLERIRVDSLIQREDAHGMTPSRILSLATCSSALPGERERTILVFAHV